MISGARFPTWNVCQCVATLLAACTPFAPALSQRGPVVPDTLGRWVFPGDSLLQSSRLTMGTTLYRITAYRDGDEYPIGQLRDVMAMDTVGGVPVLRRVQQQQRGMQRITDSSVTDFLSLAPRHHRSEQPTRRIQLDFSAKKVRASIGQPDATPAVFDTTFKQQPFDSANWDLLLRALPLAPGLKVRFLVYDTDAGVHEYRLAVKGTATILGEPAYVVIFTLSRSSDAVVWIGQQSGALLQMETMVAGNTLLRQTRTTAPTAR
jgi:hypothetical protein